MLVINSLLPAVMILIFVVDITQKLLPIVSLLPLVSLTVDRLAVALVVEIRLSVGVLGLWLGLGIGEIDGKHLCMLYINYILDLEFILRRVRSHPLNS